MIDLQDKNFILTDTGFILVSEYYMEEILRAEGATEIDDEYGTDSNLVCNYVAELGFTNLGDFGKGFIFARNGQSMTNKFYGKYF